MDIIHRPVFCLKHDVSRPGSASQVPHEHGDNAIDSINLLGS
jgi:hypothetical protein